MIVKSDQDRVRALLTEAITVLCKKRLSFKSQLSVEGLIGITLDSDDIFLVSIKELVVNSGSEESPVAPPATGEAGTPAMMGSAKVRTGRQRKSTPRHLSVVSPPLHYDVDFPLEEEEEEECIWQLQDGTDIDDLSPGTNLSRRTEAPPNGNHVHPVAKEEPLENGVQENGIDAPLNLSNTCSSSHASSRLTVSINDKPNRDITPHKRKRSDSCDNDSQFSGIVSLSAKRSSSSSKPSVACPVGYSTGTALKLVTVKQEPNIQSASSNNHLQPHFDHASTNGCITIQPAHEKMDMKGFSNGVMKDTGNILAGRTNLIESAIWQRLASPVTPFQLSSPMMPSQEITRLVENGDVAQKQCDPLPVQKAPLYSITGKLKKENKPATEKTLIKDAGNEAPAGIPTNKENGNNNISPNHVIDLEKKHMMKKFEVKILSKANIELNQRTTLDFIHKANLDFSNKNNLEFNNKTNLEFTQKANYDLNKANLEFSRVNFELNKVRLVSTKPNFELNAKGGLDTETLDKLDHSSTDVSAASEGSLDHSDGYHSYRVDSPDQENMEVYSVDSDDDVKTEDFIDRRQEPGKAVSYKCKLCERVYSNKWNCRRHIQYTHMNKTGFMCEICHNKYRDRSDYQEHLQVIHQGPGGYKCDFCDKILMSKRSLKEHVSLHTGQYRYHCIECSRGFNRLNDYQLHMTKDHGANITTVTSVEMAQMLEDASKKGISLPSQLTKDHGDVATVTSAEMTQIIEDASKKVMSEAMTPLPIVN